MSPWFCWKYLKFYFSQICSFFCFWLCIMLLMFWDSFPLNFSLINNNYLGIIMSSGGSFAHQCVLYPISLLWHLCANQDALSHQNRQTLTFPAVGGISYLITGGLGKPSRVGSFSNSTMSSECQMSSTFLFCQAQGPISPFMFLKWW